MKFIRAASAARWILKPREGLCWITNLSSFDAPIIAESPHIDYLLQNIAKKNINHYFYRWNCKSIKRKRNILVRYWTHHLSVHRPQVQLWINLIVKKHIDRCKVKLPTTMCDKRLDDANYYPIKINTLKINGSLRTTLYINIIIELIYDIVCSYFEEHLLIVVCHSHYLKFSSLAWLILTYP